MNKVHLRKDLKGMVESRRMVRRWGDINVLEGHINDAMQSYRNLYSEDTWYLAFANKYANNKEDEKS